MNNKATNLHVYSEAGGLLVGNIPTLEEAREVATAYAEKNVGKMANIFTVLESHICRVSPLEIIPATGSINKLDAFLEATPLPYERTK